MKNWKRRFSVVQAEARGGNTDHRTDCAGKGSRVAPAVERGAR